MAYNKEQIAQYLIRIGLPTDMPQTAETLSRIIRAHFCTVPYENLDIVAGKPLCLDPQMLFDKIVTRRRGGFCFELNEALGNLLTGMGYRVTHLTARFLLGEPADTVPMRRHHILLVHMPEGDYVCDAGVMREAPRMAFRLIPDQIHSDGICDYRIQTHPFYGYIVQQRGADGAFADVYGFTMEEQVNTDFVMPCFYCEKHPDSPFNKHAMVGIFTENGAWNLVGDELKRIENGTVAEKRTVMPAERTAVLKHYFGLE